MHDTHTLWNSRYLRQGEQSIPQPADPWLARWLDLLAPMREEMVLDLGCGEGRTCRYLFDIGFRHITMADLSDEALRICRQSLPQAAALQLDLREPLPFPDEHFRLVIASLCLHYFPWEMTRRMVGEIHRCVKTGGLLIVRLNSIDDVNFGAVGHPEVEPNLFQVDGELKRFFDQHSIKRLFAEGWTIHALEELTIDTRSKPKALWEVVLKKNE